MKILITCFDPFGGETINPSGKVVAALPDEWFGLSIVKHQIPTIFGKSLEVLEEKMKAVQPDVVLSIGQAAGRSVLSVERVALNLMDAGIPDNAGNRPQEEPIVIDGENALFSTLPLQRMVEAMRKDGVPAEISNTAGLFVCNQLLYGILHAQKDHPGLQGGFIHVPYLPEQVTEKPNMPSMSLDTMVKGIQAALSVIANK